MITPDGSHVPLAVKLNFEPTNNMVEYETCIAKMETLRELGAREVEVFGDSNLVIAQAQKLWKIKEEHLKPYQQYLEELTKTSNKIEHTIILKAQNQFVDALATLVSMVEIPERVWTRLLEIEQKYQSVYKEKQDVAILVIELGIYPDGAQKEEHCSVRMMKMQYILCGGKLYRRSNDEVHLCCLKKEEAKRIMEEVHPRIYDPHMNGKMLAKKILRMRFYWNTMETDCIDFKKSCHDCQTHANLNHRPPNELYSMTSQWPFSV